LNIVFAGTPQIAVPCLQALMASSHKVVAVYTQPDRPAGRGRQLTASPVKEYAQSYSLPVRQPEKMDTASQEQLKQLAPDVMVVVAYGLLLPKAVLEIPKYGCINVHFSLLPRWRGAAPIQYTLLSGDEITGVTVMQLDEGMDTGPILSQEKYPVDPEENSKMLQNRLADAGATLLLKTLTAIEQHKISPLPQDAAKATYAAKLTKSQGLIHWQKSAIDIVNQVRAFNPWPVAFTYFEGQRLRIWDAELVNVPTDVSPGTVIGVGKLGIEVASNDKMVRLRLLQLPGGRILSASEFLNARHVLPGETVFSDDEGLG